MGKPQSAAHQMKLMMTLDAATSEEMRAFMLREGYSNGSQAGKHLIQYALEEQPKNFPRGLWINVANEARNYVMGELAKFLYDMARQMGRAAEDANNDPLEKARMHSMLGGPVENES